MDVENALNYINRISIKKTGEKLKKPEITILKGCWLGMTYEQIANSSTYSTNYLMRDIAPKLWKNLSKIMGDNIGKTNFRSKLCALSESTLLKNEGSFAENIAKINLRDWKNAPSNPSVFYGRQKELDTFEQWILEEKCHLLNIWGLSGSGKSLLMKRLGDRLQDKYEVVIWRNLALYSSLSELLEDILSSGFRVYERDKDRLLSQLMAVMRSHRCLIMLDGIEATMQPQALAGKYLPGYEDCALLFKTLARGSHQSCLITTSLENFSYFSTSNNNSIRHWKLSGLSVTEAKALLQAEKLSVNQAEESVISYYQGNPAMLIFIAQIIRELFNNNIEEFLAQKSTLFDEIHRLLNNSFSRLSVLEQEILYWLAAELQPMSLEEIQSNLPLSIYPVELIEALKSLVQRSLLTIDRLEEHSAFVLSPMMREFVSDRLIAQIGNNYSLNNRLNSDPTKNIPIELGNLSAKTTHLSHWLANNSELDWQPIEILFMASRRSPARLRSALNFRGSEIVKRFKQIDLDREKSLVVLLVVAIARDGSAFKICAQAQPNLERQVLPPNLKLNLLDASQTVLASIQAQSQDNYIQLPYFRGVLEEEFGLSLSLNSLTYQEKFVI